MKKLVLLALIVSLTFAWGCAKKVKSQPEPAPAKAEKVLTPAELYDQEYRKLPTSHTVVKGECLWWISEYKQIYNDPFMWPLIYKANRAQIKKSPNLIYPGQNFAIPRDFTLDEAKAARQMAGKSKKKSDPAATAVLPGSIRTQLGYGF
ncbi:MAG TPA: peptidoglycan-binding protein [Desulfovibrio sp.]|jgi:LysM repeat protein|nr:peptidoglycan-binding protein [Desulfovibrio sp.]HBR07162.1 peptidoglycan-binding protein [Desulfovibrio sp.]